MCVVPMVDAVTSPWRRRRWEGLLSILHQTPVPWEMSSQRGQTEAAKRLRASCRRRLRHRESQERGPAAAGWRGWGAGNLFIFISRGRSCSFVLLCWCHPRLSCCSSMAPPGGRGWRRWGRSEPSVPALGGDQRFTNDVYAVVLVDTCWQNRRPVRHLEWN